MIAIGTRLGPYKVGQSLGAGGMGVVYEAEDSRLGRRVALKLLPDHISRDPVAVERFQQEARAAASLNHPHICTIYDIGADEGRHFIAMELIDGQTLRERLTGSPLDLPLLLDVAIGVADGLDAAHRAGIVHRDIKPANIFLTSRGQPKILDFGLAKIAAAVPAHTALATAEPAHLTSPGTALGTIAYMSPEQARAEEVDARTDLFSFGVVLHEMAAGVPAFPGSTSAVIFDAILNHPPAALDRMDPALARIVSKALEKDPSLRYQTAAEVRADLLRLKRDIDSGRSMARARSGSQPARARKGIDSVAVLPLVNASGDADCEYLSEGLAESLINSLSQFPKLRVALQQKAFRYRGADVDLQQAARELHVQALLTGRILLRGETLIVKISLVDAEREAQLWGQQYTKRVSDILLLQEEIAEEVVAALKLKLAGAPKKRAPKATANTDAYRTYLKGRFYWARRTPDNTKRALELFQQAIEHDPSYAQAYAGIADCYANLGFTPYGTMAPREAFPRAKIAAQRALALDPSLGDAYASLGLCAFWYDWDWAAAEREFRRSLELSPDSLGARLWYPVLLWCVGRADEAIRFAREAVAVDPLSVNAVTMLGQVLALARRPDEAIEVLRGALDMEPNYPTALAFIGFAHLSKHEYDAAVTYMESAAAVFPHPQFRSHVGLAYGLAGRREDALRVLDQFREQARSTYVSPFAISFVFQGLGEMEQWRVQMRAAVEERSALLTLLNAQWNDNVRSDPYFAELLRTVGLPNFAAERT